MKHQPVLFVGNGPNRLLEKAHSWEDLLTSLRDDAGVSKEGHDNKPFTFHFEELRNSHHKRRIKRAPNLTWEDTDLEFRSLVARKLSDLQPGKVHKELMSLPVTNILTTNYDYTLEQAIEPKSVPRSDDWGTNEVRYALFRRRAVDNRFVYHIHGEAEKPRTIMLGHEAYVDSCARIRRYSDMEGKGILFKNGIGYLKAKFRNGPGITDPSQPHSWVDLFLLRDIHIVGFGLEMTEVDIWYLLSYKARLRHDLRVPPDLKNTHISFHYFENDDPVQRARLNLLKSYDVRCFGYPILSDSKDEKKKDYFGAWDRLLKGLRRSL